MIMTGFVVVDVDVAVLCVSDCHAGNHQSGWTEGLVQQAPGLFPPPRQLSGRDFISFYFILLYFILFYFILFYYIIIIIIIIICVFFFCFFAFL